MNNEKPEYIRLVPCALKAFKTDVDGRDYEIYENNPYTQEQGTMVPTDDAIEILIRFPEIVSPATKIVDGDVVSSIDDSLWNEIKIKREERHRFVGTHEAKSKQTVPTKQSDDSVLKEIIKNQSTMMTEMQKQMAEMQKMMTALAKK